MQSNVLEDLSSMLISKVMLLSVIVKKISNNNWNRLLISPMILFYILGISGYTSTVNAGVNPEDSVLALNADFNNDTIIDFYVKIAPTFLLITNTDIAIPIPRTYRVPAMVLQSKFYYDTEIGRYAYRPELVFDEDQSILNAWLARTTDTEQDQAKAVVDSPSAPIGDETFEAFAAISDVVHDKLQNAFKQIGQIAKRQSLRDIGYMVAIGLLSPANGMRTADIRDTALDMAVLGGIGNLTSQLSPAELDDFESALAFSSAIISEDIGDTLSATGCACHSVEEAAKLALGMALIESGLFDHPAVNIQDIEAHYGDITGTGHALSDNDANTPSTYGSSTIDGSYQIGPIADSLANGLDGTDSGGTGGAGNGHDSTDNDSVGDGGSSGDGDATDNGNW